MPVLNASYSRQFHSRNLPFLHVNNIWQLKYIMQSPLKVQGLHRFWQLSVFTSRWLNLIRRAVNNVFFRKRRVSAGCKKPFSGTYLNMASESLTNSHLTAKSNSGERYAVYRHTKRLTDKMMSPVDVSDILKYVMEFISKKMQLFYLLQERKLVIFLLLCVAILLGSYWLQEIWKREQASGSTLSWIGTDNRKYCANLHIGHPVVMKLHRWIR
jgi:hypothetical protein